MVRYRPARDRLRDFLPVELALAPEVLSGELKRCQDCGVPFCHAVGCALGNAIPEINAFASAGRWEDALAVLLETSPFPEFTARVCPGLCEGSCVQALHDSAVPCRQVEREVIERAFARGLIAPRPPAVRRNLSAAVVGSGPAGLATAWALNRAGLSVTVYEKDARAGGFLRYGIPDFKLEKEVLDRRLRLLEAEGVAFECGVEAGVDLSARWLRRRHDAVVLACGARAPRDLDLPGRALSGVHFALAFLSAQNRVNGDETASVPESLSARGRRVVVVGGGDTGSDCVGTALRQKAASVVQFEILPEPPCARTADNPWPEWPRIRRDSSSHAEGGSRRWNVQSLAFLPAPDHPERLGGLRCAEVDWLRGDDPRAPARPVIRHDSEWTEPADLVLLATGFTGVAGGAPFAELGAALTSRGLLAREEMGRAARGVYVAGDAGAGPTLVVRAIADGLRIARACLADLGVSPV